MHGVPLTGQVIAAVRRDPAAGALPYLLPYVNVPWVEGGVANPMDEALLADAAFPSGRPLPPSLRAWLAYDISLRVLSAAGWLGLPARPGRDRP